MDKLESEVLDGGHVDLSGYLFMLERMDEENMKDWERRMMSEIRELRIIKDDIKALKEHILIREDEITIPDWIQDP